MSGAGPAAALLQGGRLHLQHGPIDLICHAEGPDPDARDLAFAAAAHRFDGLLQALVDELPDLRRPLAPDSAAPRGPVARRMHRAALPHCATFVTPMIAVAGSVADEVLAAMRAATPLARAFVNNGGDIALHLAPGTRYAAAIAGLDGADLGRIAIGAGDRIGGIATSGARGRSLSLGIADSVTVLARSAAAADVAATLIANAVDLPGHPAILRAPADDMQPDSDLGARLVTRHVPKLSPADRATALVGGQARAQAMLDAGLIDGAALFVQGAQALAGHGFETHALTGRHARAERKDHAET